MKTLKEHILTELYGKGKLADIVKHHHRRAAYKGKLADVADDAGEEDDAQEHGMEAMHHETKADRGRALMRQRDSAAALGRAKREHDDAKKKSRQAKRNVF